MSLLDQLTEYLHLRYPDHKDPKSGLSKDCEYCRQSATEMMCIETLAIDAALSEVTVTEVPFGHA